MASGNARVAASILTADFANLYRELRRGEKAGVDRFHLDIMDGHFVPNITFGPAVVRAIRRITKLPLDLHLMIGEPSRYVDPFIEAGGDSLTFHVEVDEPKEPTLRRIRRAGRAAGLAVGPGTPAESLEPYAGLLDIVMVMTVEPGFGGQDFMPACAAKIPGIRELLGERPLAEIHVDGGVNRDNAELLGGLGADVLVAGSALYTRGRDMGRETRLMRALADEGWAHRHGTPPIDRDRWVVIASLGQRDAEALGHRVEGLGIPTLVLRGDLRAPDGETLRDVLVPARAEAFARRRLGEVPAR
ncbi:MAG: ribulose-phosphate 3-epimerase [Chloroflexi bacterium GWC2_73_18]|nr:MAG: ribulose-phosphate 3-epimerase [Chloroflexi bacterium GWC2_73_18]